MVNWTFFRVLSLTTNLIDHFLFCQGYKIPWFLAKIKPKKNNENEYLEQKWSNSRFSYNLANKGKNSVYQTSLKRHSKFRVTIKTRGVEKILAPFYFLLTVFLMIPLEAFYRQLLNHTCHLGVQTNFGASNNCFLPFLA